ncbi:MAG: aminoacetone oxidase family FAD-binding enzyme, partial [Lentisphaeria bacterium]
PRPGLKLLASGGGRCNLGNVLEPAAFMARFGRDGRFLAPALQAFPPAAQRRWFAAHGVPVHAADGFHYFPVAESARVVLDALLAEARRLQVRFLFETPVRALLRDPAAGNRVCGVQTAAGELRADAVVLAAGGLGYPGLGGGAAGLELARAAGHSVVPPVPGLAPLPVTEPWVAECAGVVLNPARLRIALPGFPKAGIAGELLFTHQGLSGPVALDLSAAVAQALAGHPAGVPLQIAIRPDWDAAAWQAQLEHWRTHDGRKSLANLVDRLLPASLAGVVARLAGVATLTAARLDRAARDRLVALLTALPVTVVRPAGWDRAMVMAGGVSRRETDPETLESRWVPGLYLAGELLDVDGPCGGFNLTWAFASGRLAGRAAAA